MVGCISHSSTSTDSPTVGDGRLSPGARGGRLLSIIQNNDISGVETIEAWKIDAESIAASGDAALRLDYTRLKGLVDLWVNRKKLEVAAAAKSSLSRKADLSSGAISPQMKETAARVITTGSKSNPFTLLKIAGTIDRLIATGRSGEVETVSAQLEALRLQDWGS
jgi:hypothetical protein